MSFVYTYVDISPEERIVISKDEMIRQLSDKYTGFDVSFIKSILGIIESILKAEIIQKKRQGIEHYTAPMYDHILKILDQIHDPCARAFLKTSLQEPDAQFGLMSYDSLTQLLSRQEEEIEHYLKLRRWTEEDIPPYKQKAAEIADMTLLIIDLKKEGAQRYQKGERPDPEKENKRRELQAINRRWNNPTFWDSDNTENQKEKEQPRSSSKQTLSFAIE